MGLWAKLKPKAEPFDFEETYGAAAGCTASTNKNSDCQLLRKDVLDFDHPPIGAKEDSDVDGGVVIVDPLQERLTANVRNAVWGTELRDGIILC